MKLNRIRSQPAASRAATWSGAASPGGTPNALPANDPRYAGPVLWATDGAPLADPQWWHGMQGGTSMTMPLAMVVAGAPDSGGYTTLGYAEAAPLWTTDGAAVPADKPGRWGQLKAAGRP